MSSSPPGLRHTLRAFFWPAMEPALADASREGELVIGRARIGLTLLYLLSPIATLARRPSETPAQISFLLAAVFVMAGALTVRIARRQTPPRWLGLVTTVLDVTLVSLFHATIFATGFPVMAVSSRITFALYLFVIVAAGLRYDSRLCVVAGVLASVEWLALIGWARMMGYAEAALGDGRFYGDIALTGQFEELVVLAVATALGLIIVERARALRLSSVRDDLTHLMNRSYFEERFALELLRAGRHNRPLALAILDLDRFKMVNDSWGHPAGDAVLREAAARIHRIVRRTDLVARVGGDEFAIVLPETSAADAAAKVEEIRVALAGQPIDIGQGFVAITCSAGVAAAGADGDTALALTAVADNRLMTAKREGRDRVISVGEPLTSIPHAVRTTLHP